MSASLTQAIEDMRTMRESFDSLIETSTALSPDVAQGKTALATAITSKGVTTSATDSLATMAQKVQTISQGTYEIDGGEMYAKQLFGSLETPNYWNLYEVLENLLSDGRLVNYGGILLAEYYKGYDSLALAGAGAGGAYVVSDKDSQGNFIMYTEDTTHTWDTAFDGKGNRWVAYCFADAGHDFTIADTNTSPRSIHIGRHVGNITSVVNGRVSEIVVTDGNTLDAFYNSGDFTQNFGKRFVLKTRGTTAGKVIHNSSSIETLYFEGGHIQLGRINFASNCSNLSFAIMKAESISIDTYDIFSSCANLKNVIIECPLITGSPVMTNTGNINCYFRLEQISGTFYVRGGGATVEYIYIGYFTNDRTKPIVFTQYGAISQSPTDVELQDGWHKPLNVAIFTGLTAENIALHMLDKLADNTGEETLTLTIGSTNLNRILADETYAPYVTAAQAKNWTIA